MTHGTWKLRLIALAGAIACLGLAFGFATGMPLVIILSGLLAMIGGPVLLFTQGWLGAWLLALIGLWGGSMLLFLLNGNGAMWDLMLMWLVLAGLTGLGVAVVPPQVAARHRAAWPFGYLRAQEPAEKAKRARLLLEEEIVYDVVADDWEDEDENEQAFPLAKRKSSAR